MSSRQSNSPHISSRQQRSLSSSLLLVSVLAAPFRETSAIVEDTVSTSKLCYSSGENPLISFENINPSDEDWVGVYPSSIISGDEEPSLWLWTCGTQGCWGKMTSGMISFGENSEYNDEWPLDLGSYRAVLARTGDDDESAYDIYATSPIFAVESSCSPEPTETSPAATPTPTTSPPVTPFPTAPIPTTPRPTTASPMTPIPTGPNHPTTPRPSLRQPTVDNTWAPNKQDQSNTASVIAAAKQEIGHLIVANPTLSALFLRMVFHDCVGGCDGCINMSNPDNARLDSAMFTLDPLVAKYEPLGLTRPDLWVLATMTGVELTMPDTDFVSIPFNTIGRQACDVDHMTQGPNPDLCSHNFGTDDILAFFRAHFGFTPQETAAIMGGHTIGTMHREVLGFDGPNGHTPDYMSFNNDYYKELVGPGSTYQEQVDNAPNWQQAFVDNSDLNNVPDRFQWEGYPNEKKVVMKNADIALVRQLHSGNKAFDGHVDCQFVPRGGEQLTCPMARSDLFVEMVKYRNDNRCFLEDFRDALTRMTQTGYIVDANTCDSDGICRLIKA